VQAASDSGGTSNTYGFPTLSSVGAGGPNAVNPIGAGGRVPQLFPSERSLESEEPNMRACPEQSRGLRGGEKPCCVEIRLTPYLWAGIHCTGGSWVCVPGCREQHLACRGPPAAGRFRLHSRPCGAPHRAGGCTLNCGKSRSRQGVAGFRRELGAERRGLNCAPSYPAAGGPQGAAGGVTSGKGHPSSPSPVRGRATSVGARPTHRCHPGAADPGLAPRSGAEARGYPLPASRAYVHAIRASPHFSPASQSRRDARV